MGMMDINKELGGFKGRGISLIPTPKQNKYLIRNIAGADDEVLWSELGELRGNAVVTFREIGRRLQELQTRYSNRGNGEFEKRWRALGFKKMEVYTLIKKYDLYTLDTSKEESIMLESADYEEKNVAEVLEGEIVCSADKDEVAEKLEGASQRVISALDKAPTEVRKEYYEGKINSEKEVIKAAELAQLKRDTGELAIDKLVGDSLERFGEELLKAQTTEEVNGLIKTYEIGKEKPKQLSPGKIIREEVIEDDRREARVKELNRELKDIDREIAELLEAERRIKLLREQRAEVIEELSKVNNLKLI